MARRRKSRRRVRTRIRARKSTTKRKTIYRRSTKRITMARKRRGRRRKGVFGGGSFPKMAQSAAIAAVIEPVADQFIASFAPQIPTVGSVQSDDLVKVGIGYFLGKRSGMVGSTARFIGLFGVRNIVKQLVGGGLSLTAPVATTPATTQTVSNVQSLQTV